MASDALAPDSLPSATAPDAADWKLRLSLWLTVVWLVLGALYISGVVGWMGFIQQRAPDLGGFLEGAFAPLAFLWLVVGFFLQRQQLEQNTDAIRAQIHEMRRTAEQAEVQSRAIAADELHSRQDTFIRVADMVQQQLGTIAGFLVTSMLAEMDDDAHRGPGIEQLWDSMGLGDDTAFNRKVFSLTYSGTLEATGLFFGTEIRSGHTRSFMHAFERLIEHAERCDPDGIIADAIRGGGHGRLYGLMAASRPTGG